jgi:CheY-like chemotaxis protein
MEGLLERSLGPSVELIIRFDAGLPPVYTDANQLENALLNLAVNARDAMPDGGRVTIEGAAQTLPSVDSVLGLPAGDYVRLSLSDEGHGMDEATLARATEPFYTTKGIGKGTGLGLAMVHGLAEQSGGRLQLTSRVGEGTRADIWLRRASALCEPRAVPAEDSSEAGRMLTVLAVDDDALVLMNTVAMLEDLGHQAIGAESAAEALAALQDRAVDLVITDHAMPHMTGLQLAGRIAAEHPSLPVVLATGYAELPPGEGADLPKLAKPYNQSDLARMLRSLS